MEGSWKSCHSTQNAWCGVQVDTAYDRLENLEENIRDTEEFVNFELDSSRNRLIRLEIVLTAATFGLAIFGTVAGKAWPVVPAVINGVWGAGLLSQQQLQESHAGAECTAGMLLVMHVSMPMLMLSCSHSRSCGHAWLQLFLSTWQECTMSETPTAGDLSATEQHCNRLCTQC